MFGLASSYFLTHFFPYIYLAHGYVAIHSLDICYSFYWISVKTWKSNGFQINSLWKYQNKSKCFPVSTTKLCPPSVLNHSYFETILNGFQFGTEKIRVRSSCSYSISRIYEVNFSQSTEPDFVTSILSKSLSNLNKNFSCVLKGFENV